VISGLELGHRRLGHADQFRSERSSSFVGSINLRTSLGSGSRPARRHVAMSRHISQYFGATALGH
jgi:hypothetical protein